MKPAAAPVSSIPAAAPVSSIPAAAPVRGIPVTGFPVSGGGSSAWSSGLFSCFEDCGVCCLTCWCPCVTFGRVAEMVDRGSTSCGASGALYALITAATGGTCQWVYSCTYRRKMRAQYGLSDEPCCDCCVHLCCECCALSQQYRELTARGFDPSIGWQLNMDRRGGAAAAYPPAVQEMGRW